VKYDELRAHKLIVNTNETANFGDRDAYAQKLLDANANFIKKKNEKASNSSSKALTSEAAQTTNRKQNEGAPKMSMGSSIVNCDQEAANSNQNQHVEQKVDTNFQFFKGSGYNPKLLKREV